MKPSDLEEMGDSEWPDDAGSTLVRFLRDAEADRAERRTAIELAADVTVIDDDVARALLAIARNEREFHELRDASAIALGPALEESDLFAFDELDLDDEPSVSSDVVLEIQSSLRRLFLDADAPKSVRRRALEASVRAPQEWHDGAVRQAFESDDRDWRLTAVFCAQYVRGFAERILEALESDDPDILYEAVVAAGAAEVRGAWRRIAALIECSDKDLRLTAIEAAPAVDPQKAFALLVELPDQKDAEVREALESALGMCSVMEGDDDEIPY